MICDKYNSVIMEYKKLINFLDDLLNQPFKFTVKTCVKVNDDARGTHTTPIVILNLKLQC